MIFLIIFGVKINTGPVRKIKARISLWSAGNGIFSYCTEIALFGVIQNTIYEMENNAWTE